MGVVAKVIIIAVICGITWQIDNGLALTPPLVFALGCSGDEGSVMRQVDQLLASGLASKGYRYVLIGPYWQVKMGLLRASEIKQEGSRRISTISQEYRI